jgi:hypothetical protein
MTFLYALCLSAGIAGFAYTRLGKRVGYTNTQNVIVVVGVIFVLSTIVSFTIFATVLHP